MVMNHHCMREITYQSFQTIMNELFGSPISALRCTPHHCGVQKVRLILRDLRRLELVLFTLPSNNSCYFINRNACCSGSPT